MSNVISIDAYESKKRVAGYDADMDIMHPNRLKMVEVALEFLPFETNKTLKVVDLGIGTGFFTERFLKKFANSEVIAVDGAQSMVDLAKARLEGAVQKIDFKIADFREFKNVVTEVESIDVVFSSFSLHHLNADEKLNVMKHVLKILKPNGWFFNAETIVGETGEIEERFQKLRVDGILKRSGGKDPRFKDFSAVRMFLDELEAKEKDQPLPLSKELEIVKGAGFKNIDTLWREYREAVFCGQKG